jgi:DNA-binding GntR family transcriptional regulator
MTLESIGSRQRREMGRLLTAMRRAARIGDLPGWFEAHHAYHRVMTAGAGEPLLRTLESLEDRSVRYIRIYQQSEPGDWQTAGDAEHAAILDALADGDDRAALTGLAHHLARTALRVLADCAPDYTPRAVPQAVALAEGADSAALQAASAG